ncbi:MAG TPA: hypothetical protein VE267_14380 [Bradyrhizobium sp.]|nr:hypothetical protein [Bradyrhizobium sp.]
MPTIYPVRCFKWWARKRFAHPTKPICLPAASLSAQAKYQSVTATKQHDGQISKNLSSPLAKNIPLCVSGKSVA